MGRADRVHGDASQHPDAGGGRGPESSDRNALPNEGETISDKDVLGIAAKPLGAAGTPSPGARSPSARAFEKLIPLAVHVLMHPDYKKTTTGETAAAPAIVPAEVLRDLLGSGEDIVILDARGKRADYDAGHLVGARHADPGEHLSSAAEPNANPARGGRHPLPDVGTWRRTLGVWGVSPETLVVVYDDQAGANAAARAWWMLRSVGHLRVGVLDGGLDAARSIGLPETNAAPTVSVKPPYLGRGWQRPTVDLATVDEQRKDPAWILLDVRSRERFAGETEPIDPVAGHIPGAVNLPFVENLVDGRFKTRQALRDLYEKVLAGVNPDHLVVHCGSGVTACHTLLALEHAGMNGAALYVGSWSEWCRSGRPCEPERSGPEHRAR